MNCIKKQFNKLVKIQNEFLSRVYDLIHVACSWIFVLVLFCLFKCVCVCL